MKRDIIKDSKIKRTLRRFLPAGRTYVDKRLAEQEKLIEKLFEEQKTEAHHDLEAHVKKVTESVSENAADIKKTLLEMKKEEEKHSTQRNRRMQELTRHLDRELERRDEWPVIRAEMEWQAAGRKIWVIKCPAPEGDARFHWGDYSYAVALKKYLERKNLYVRIDTRQDWLCEESADVVLVLRGKEFFRPDRRNKKCVYIMWNISHPDMVSEEEYELYDVVCAGSAYLAEALRKKVSVPVVPLLQCTDTELFCPDGEREPAYEDAYIFIGNTRNVRRDCVYWAVENGIPLHIWGNGWEKMLPDYKDYLEDLIVRNEHLPALYRSARVTLNDHWKDMLDYQMMNNRILDALACGLPVISDGFEEMRKNFPDAVLYYRNQEEFEECLHRIETDYASVKQAANRQFAWIKKEYSFERRAEQLVELAEKYRHSLE